MKITHRYVCLRWAVALTFVVTTAHASGDEEGRGMVTVERLGDCPRAVTIGGVRLGEDGPEIMGLGSYAFLGVDPTPLTPELRRHFGVPEDLGVMIGRVEEGSPAEIGGLLVGDIITRLDGRDVTTGGRLRRLIRSLEEGDEVTLEYWRDGRVAQTSIALAEQPRCGLDVSRLIDLDKIPHLKLENRPVIELKGLKSLPRWEHVLRLHELDSEASGKATDYYREALSLHLQDTEAMEEASQRLREALENQDWEHHLERFRDVDIQRIEERLQEAMERLHQLEDEIDSEKMRIRSKDDSSEI